LTAVQNRFWNAKPPEELYDLTNDPDEVQNLAGSRGHREILDRLRQVQREHAIAVRDVGFLPEAEIHSRARETAPYEMGHDDATYPLQRVMHAAELASSLSDDAINELQQLLRDNDSAVRYWAALGIGMRGDTAVRSSREALHQVLSDDSPSVRISAAEALGRHGDESDLASALRTLSGVCGAEPRALFVVVHALNVLDGLGSKAAPAAAQIKSSLMTDSTVSARMKDYVPRLLEAIAANAASATK
jgi:uncharacterized sulfatase